MSRFDLIYVVLDDKSSDLDRRIAERVTRNHRFQGPNLFESFFRQIEDGGVIEEQVNEPGKDEDMFEKHNPMLHENKDEQILTRAFLKKYLYYARQIVPQLSDETSNFITKSWSELRTKDFEYTKSHGDSRVIPVTVRTLESLIRLSTAHAKLRLSETVEISDCEAAYTMLCKTLFETFEHEDQLAQQYELCYPRMEPVAASKPEAKTRQNKKMDAERENNVKKSAGKQVVKDELGSYVVIDAPQQAKVNDENINPARPTPQKRNAMDAETPKLAPRKDFTVTINDEKAAFKALVATKEKRERKGEAGGIPFTTLFELLQAQYPEKDQLIQILESLVKKDKVVLDQENGLIHFMN